MAGEVLSLLLVAVAVAVEHYALVVAVAVVEVVDVVTTTTAGWRCFHSFVGVYWLERLTPISVFPGYQSTDSQSI